MPDGYPCLTGTYHGYPGNQIPVLHLTRNTVALPSSELRWRMNYSLRCNTIYLRSVPYRTNSSKAQVGLGSWLFRRYYGYENVIPLFLVISGYLQVRWLWLFWTFLMNHNDLTGK